MEPVHYVVEGDAALYVIRGKDGYVDRDGRLPEGETSRLGSQSPASS